MWVVGTVPRSVCGGSHVSMERRWAGAVAVECMSGFVLQEANSKQRATKQQAAAYQHGESRLARPTGSHEQKRGQPRGAGGIPIQERV